MPSNTVVAGSGTPELGPVTSKVKYPRESNPEPGVAAKGCTRSAVGIPVLEALYQAYCVKLTVLVPSTKTKLFAPGTGPPI